MKNSSNNSWVWALISLLAPMAWSQEVHTEKVNPSQGQAIRIVETLFRFDPDQALIQVDQADALDPHLKAFFQAWCAHQKGDYQGVLDLLTMPPENLPADSMIQNRFQEMKATAKELVHFKTRQTPHFSIRFKAGKDEVLAHFIPEVLEAFYTYYSRFFNYQSSERILVEIMPDHELFSYACALTKKQIETTGTVALCVENRLAMITPRRVLKGYDWAHVLSHEFIHYLLTKTSHNHAPLWFQEGVAKAFEHHWDTTSPEALDRTLESSLAAGLKANRLVTMEEMHPSFAALPTPQLAHLAYAQVASMVDYMNQLKGPDFIPHLAHSLAREPDINTLLEHEFGFTFNQFQSQWETWARKQNYRIVPHMALHKTKLLDSDKPEESLSKAEGTNETERKFRRLADLLLERNRWQAALIEYRKCEQELRKEKKGPMDRQLILRFLKCHQAMGGYQAIEKLIGQEIEDFSTDSTMLQFKALARWHQDDPQEALHLLKMAVRVNPFDPGIYTLQQDIAVHTHDKELLDEAEQLLTLLTATK